MPVIVNCKVGSRALWFPCATLKVVGSDATVVCDAFDSSCGEQVVHVQSKHGFSHTDRVASVFDTYTLAVVSFVRESKFGADDGSVSGGQVWATAKALAAARKLGLR